MSKDSSIHDDDDDDDGEIWKGLVPLHVEKIVDPLAPTFDFRLLSTLGSIRNDNNNMGSGKKKICRTFSIAQDREGRRKPATATILGANTNLSSSSMNHSKGDNDAFADALATTIAQEGLTEHTSQTGAVLWDGAVVAAGILDNIAKIMAREARLPQTPKELPALLHCNQKVVLELGCGCASLPGMAALALGAKHVFLTDLEPILESEALATNLTKNLEAHEDSKVTKMVYRWGDDQFDPMRLFSYREGLPCGVDLILTCDTVYDMALVIPLLDSIELIMRSSNDIHPGRSCKALVCYDESIGRNKAYRFFREEAKKRFSVVNELTESEKRHDLRPYSVKAFLILHPITRNQDDSTTTMIPKEKGNTKPLG